MVRLSEHDGKAVLARAGLAVPEGRLCATADEVRAAAEALGGRVVVKAQAFTTKRKDQGGIVFADDAAAAGAAAETILAGPLGEHGVRVEGALAIADEVYASILIDDAARSPMLLYSTRGGTGIEEVADETPDAVSRTPLSMDTGLDEATATAAVEAAGGEAEPALITALGRLWEAWRGCEARTLEVNPLVKLEDGSWAACDCRATVDDYAVFRHDELGIEIARESDRPPTDLERIGWAAERDDYRGTFFFLELSPDYDADAPVVAFHGTGGGGAMMSMDAAIARGLTPANFIDTSGNPPASKVYRAARLALAQGPVVGYFGSGSGVASQEQFHVARGLVKAFREVGLSIPVVMRLGGNAEDLAVEILETHCADLPAPVEGYRKTDTPAHIAERMETLIEEGPYGDGPAGSLARASQEPERPTESPNQTRFATLTGEVVLDHAACLECEAKPCLTSCVPQILTEQDGVPVLNIDEADAARGGCTECLACEVECAHTGNHGGTVFLPMAGLAAAAQVTT